MTAIQDLTPGTRIRHLKWDITGTIRIAGDVTEIRWDDSFVSDEISDEGVVYPGDVKIIEDDAAVTS